MIRVSIFCFLVYSSFLSWTFQYMIALLKPVTFTCYVLYWILSRGCIRATYVWEVHENLIPAYQVMAT
jgi:hypothetical protein